MTNEIKENVEPTLEYLKICVEDDTSFETTNCKALLDYITNLQEENKNKTDYICDLVSDKVHLQQRIDKATNDIDTTIEIIKEQPTGNDNWILSKLNSTRYILQGEDKE